MIGVIHHSFKFQYLIPVIVAVVGPLAGIRLFYYLTRRGFSPTTGALPPYPIILKPYPTILILLRFIMIAWIALGAYLISIRFGVAVFVVPILLIPIVCWFETNKFSQSRVIIEPDKIIYKTNKKEEVMLATEIFYFFVSERTSEVVLAMEQEDRKLKIPLLFQHMCYLYDALSDWTESKPS